ncbi:uncharacterized protein LOC141900863 [Tubulanus polymorphus]|uniref:uncharacterized protein LOC141900863 n=1 Tax=Tubulanus polymorphus TaxID=672921 RepID=UPI003DA5C2D0
MARAPLTQRDIGSSGSLSLNREYKKTSRGKPSRSLHEMDKKQLRLWIDRNDSLYPGLKRLKLRGKELSKMPNSLWGLIDLEMLDLSPERESCMDYRLPHVPREISKLINLKILLLDTNQLISLPSELCLLTSLERLTLSNNLLSELPNDMPRMRRLQSLHLANNDFKEFPIQICDIPRLEFFDISGNKIRSVPERISHLKHLESLILFDNKIERLPDGLCALIRLRLFWVGNNRIKYLPREFGKLKLLDWGWHYTSTTMDGNPLIHPPIDVCRQGPDAIEDYMQRMGHHVQREQDRIYVKDKPYKVPPIVEINDDDEEQELIELEEERANDFLTVDHRKSIRELRRGSTPIPSPLPDQDW